MQGACVWVDVAVRVVLLSSRTPCEHVGIVLALPLMCVSMWAFFDDTVRACVCCGVFVSPPRPLQEKHCVTVKMYQAHIARCKTQPHLCELCEEANNVRAGRRAVGALSGAGT